jgi:hypothetical protein
VNPLLTDRLSDIDPSPHDTDAWPRRCNQAIASAKVLCIG